MSAPVSAPAALRRTPLYEVHRELGAKLIDFGGWEMPVQYAGILEEHRAVRERVGIFDVSHMGELEFRGPGSLDAVQRLTSNDVAKLADGRCHYSAFLTDRGTFVDDLLVYRRGAESWMLVVNASNTPKDFEWARSRATGPGGRVEDASDRWALIAVQGPRAAGLLSRLAQPDPTDLAYYAFREGTVAGEPALVSRTGYTGEDGFELYLSPESSAKVFRALLTEGQSDGIAPCGLGARDTLRLEAKMALYGNDIDETVTPWEADLGWIVKMKKGDFVGRAALERQKAEGVPRKLVGFEMVEPSVPRHGYRVLHGGVPVGQVTSGTFGPSVERYIGMAYVPAALSAVGSAFDVEIRGQARPARVVRTPFHPSSVKKP